ncbi:S8 family serine peptidase [Roseibacillus persicicus]|uniref:S8 family peptidase n=1 Tax=Roseibacillus persicicus TaxID=454148 RepID=UPI00398B06BC
MKIKPLELTLISVFLVLAVVGGWLLVSDVAGRTAQKKEKSESSTPVLVQSHPTARSSGNAPTRSLPDTQGDPLFSIPNQRLVQFDNEEDYRKFLASLADSDLRLLGSIDALRTALVGFDRLSDFDGLLDSEEMGYNYLVTLPLPPGEGEVQAGAVGFHGNALEWLGITGDNSTWGEGVIVAIIDTGVTNHEALTGSIRHINLVEGDDSADTWHGHGTAVASLIAGTSALTPGVSPGVSLLDVRVADVNGDSTSFKLAEGIVAAVDAGAQILNISMGSYGDSLLVRNAVEYAYTNGAVIVASSGNEGYDQPAFPADYAQVTAVGAVDQEGTVVNFSNYGENLDMTAPGLEVYAAWTNDRYIEFTGTSASAPYVTAAVAAAMSEYELNANNAMNLVTQNSNEAGDPGADSYYGVGHLDVGRVVNSGTSGIYDIAAVSNLITTDDGNMVLAVVQNQGTEAITGAKVTITTPYSSVPLQVQTLSPGDIQTFEIPTALPANGDFEVSTSVSLNSSFQDVDPENNIRSNVFEFNSSQ